MMTNFLLENHEFLGNHSIPEFIVGYIFAAALIIGAPVVFLIISFMSALMKTLTLLNLCGIILFTRLNFTKLNQ